MMNIKCSLALTNVEKHGFLTIYEVVSGYGSWSRYWFYLSGEKLSFWRYPEDENVKVRNKEHSRVRRVNRSLAGIFNLPSGS